MTMLAASLVLASYLLGSVSSAILICRLLGKPDPRTVGSQNPGATNVLRTVGKGAALATLLGDVGKAVPAVLLARALRQPEAIVAACAAAAFLGHLFPLYFRFEGGKGVATFLGALLALSPVLGLSFAGSWLAIAGLTRFSSLAALGATLAMPLLCLGLAQPWPVTLAVAVMGAAIFYRHRANIARLLAGTESRIGKRRA